MQPEVMQHTNADHRPRRKTFTGRTPIESRITLPSTWLYLPATRAGTAPSHTPQFIDKASEQIQAEGAIGHQRSHAHGFRCPTSHATCRSAGRTPRPIACRALRRMCTRNHVMRHICTGTGLTPPTSSPGPRHATPRGPPIGVGAYTCRKSLQSSSVDSTARIRPMSRSSLFTSATRASWTAAGSHPSIGVE